jgi:hypothetical protein
MIRDNRGMGRLCLVFAVAMLLANGCSPPSASSQSTTVSSSPSLAPNPRPAAAEKPAKPAGKAAARQPAPLRDEFGLPLVIQLNPPPVPPEIQKPSPPIQEPKAP